MKHIAVLAFLAFFSEANAQFFHQKAAQSGLFQAKNTNGIAAADFDRDGDIDLFLTGIKNFDKADTSTWSRLFRNDGNGKFEDVTMAAGFENQFVNEGLKAERGEKMGASWGDFDNDGWPDLFMANSRENQLFRNRGDGTFEDVTQKAGVAGCNVCYSATGLWWDHDRDGDLDLYVSNLNTENVFYENLGGGTFRDATMLFGLGGGSTITWSSVAFDAGKDGFLDLLNVNDTQQKVFFENRSGKNYNDAALAYRLDDLGAGMGVAIGDPNGDGLFDLFITNIFNHAPNPLFMAVGPRRFSDEAKKWGVEDTGWGWGTAFLDFDHDGDEDLAAVNGPIDKVSQVVQPDIGNFFFENKMSEGQERFEDVSAASGTDGLAKSKGLAVADFDADGDLDMAVANMAEAAYFFENQTISSQNTPNPQKNWLQVRLEGVVSNRDGFGSTVKIRLGADRWLHRFHHGAAIFGQNILPVHFGIGAATAVEELRVTWPTGKTEAFFSVAANQIFDLKEGTGQPVVETGGGSSGPGAIVEKTWAEPSPFSEKTDIIFQFAEAGEAEIRVWDAVGRLVFSKKKVLEEAGRSSFELAGGGLASGLFFYEIRLGERRVLGRAAKN